MSPIASCLVIAPKATEPFIRLCGDYREINQYVAIPHVYIPHVQRILEKAKEFSVLVDLDITNSFHQIPLEPVTSARLSIQTPWGLVQPRFLPEGVGPASGILQKYVEEIFHDYMEWVIVIFDNFLVLAHDYEDAYKKLELVLIRCADRGVILKFSKS